MTAKNRNQINCSVEEYWNMNLFTICIFKSHMLVQSYCSFYVSSARANWGQNQVTSHKSVKEKNRNQIYCSADRYWLKNLLTIFILKLQVLVQSYYSFCVSSARANWCRNQATSHKSMIDNKLHPNRLQFWLVLKYNFLTIFIWKPLVLEQSYCSFYFSSKLVRESRDKS